MEGLRGHTSGYAVPTYVVDAPGGGGKIPVMPNYLISYSDHKVVLRNYEGYITTYEEPEHYEAHDKSKCKYCQNPRPEVGQGGIEGLLDGKQMWIEPSGFEQTHRRGNETAHRLQDPSKWVPYAVGAIEGTAGQRVDLAREALDFRLHQLRKPPHLGRVHPDSAPLHARQHPRQRQVDRFVDRAETALVHFALERAGEFQDAIRLVLQGRLEFAVQPPPRQHLERAAAGI